MPSLAWPREHIKGDLAAVLHAQVAAGQEGQPAARTVALRAGGQVEPEAAARAQRGRGRATPHRDRDRRRSLRPPHPNTLKERPRIAAPAPTAPHTAEGAPGAWPVPGCQPGSARWRSGTPHTRVPAQRVSGADSRRASGWSRMQSGAGGRNQRQGVGIGHQRIWMLLEVAK